MNMSVDRQKTIAKQRLFSYYMLKNQLVCICCNEFQKLQINRYFTLNDDILDLVNHSVFDQKKFGPIIKKCRNMHVNQIRDLSLQIRFQKFRSRQRFFDNYSRNQ